MNKKKRGSLKDAEFYLNKALHLIREVKEEEQDDLDNMPENLQDSDRCEAMDAAIDSMEDAITYIDMAKKCTDQAISQ